MNNLFLSQSHQAFTSKYNLIATRRNKNKNKNNKIRHRHKNESLDSPKAARSYERGAARLDLGGRGINC